MPAYDNGQFNRLVNRWGIMQDIRSFFMAERLYFVILL